MAKETGEQLRDVIFFDRSTNKKFLINTTLSEKKTPGTDTFEGKSYPVFEIDISSAGHAAWVGDSKKVQTQGRAAKFENKYARFEQEAKKRKEAAAQGQDEKGAKGRRRTK